MATSAIAATSIAYAFATFFARRLADAGISSVAVAFYRFALSAVVLARLVNLNDDKRRPTCWALLSGFLMGLGWIAYVHAIEVGDVATAGVAYMTYPFFALVAGRLLFKIQLTARAVVGAALVLLAAAAGLGATPTGGFTPVVLIAPATFGFAVTVLTERLGALDPFERLGAVALGATLGMSPLLATMAPAEVIPGTPTGWLWIVGIGVGSALIPMTIYAAAAPAIGSARSAVAGAAELPTVFLIGAVFFGESIRVGHGLAAILILAAITLTPTTRGPHVSPTEDARDAAPNGTALRLTASPDPHTFGTPSGPPVRPASSAGADEVDRLEHDPSHTAPDDVRVGIPLDIHAADSQTPSSRRATVRPKSGTRYSQ